VIGAETLIRVLQKYRLHRPVSEADQARIERAGARTLRLILRQETAGPMRSTAVALLCALRGMGVAITPAWSGRLANAALAACAIVVVGAASVALRSYVYDPHMAARDLAVGSRGSVLFVIGDATIRSQDAQPRRAAVRDSIVRGDVLQTGPASQVAVQIGSHVVFTLEPDTSVAVTALFESSGARLDLHRGTILSKVMKLGKDARYAIATTNAVAAVRGTGFSVAYEPVKTTVSVSEGAVLVRFVAPATGAVKDEKELGPGSTAIVTDRLEIRDAERAEGLRLGKLAALRFIPVEAPGDERALADLAAQYRRAAEDADKKISGDTERPLTLDELRAKYNRIDTVRLYNGKVITGVIVSRGATYRILTPAGTVSVSQDDIKSTK